MAVEITLANGSKYLITRAQFVGEIVDSNGQAAGGFTTFVFNESEVNAIGSVIDMQTTYNSLMSAITPATQTE